MSSICRRLEALHCSSTSAHRNTHVRCDIPVIESHYKPVSRRVAPETTLCRPCRSCRGPHIPRFTRHEFKLWHYPLIDTGASAAHAMTILSQSHSVLPRPYSRTVGNRCPIWATSSSIVNYFACFMNDSGSRLTQAALCGERYGPLQLLHICDAGHCFGGRECNVMTRQKHMGSVGRRWEKVSGWFGPFETVGEAVMSAAIKTLGVDVRTMGLGHNLGYASYGQLNMYRTNSIVDAVDVYQRPIYDQDTSVVESECTVLVWRSSKEHARLPSHGKTQLCSACPNMIIAIPTAKHQHLSFSDVCHVVRHYHLPPPR
ncbi:hypothetical protein HBH53_189570 [Parastagonospora nodorum]|nr:hypothetical protein HBH53_189570 [Parastagonospora nodorum]KAH5145210.1 hypothetical protein HBH69_184600 [Parastagonospora nodorum]KAH6032687.1 hypothetical protein HBI54_210200 [Parastagonospora nodorum]